MRREATNYKAISGQVIRRLVTMLFWIVGTAILSACGSDFLLNALTGDLPGTTVRDAEDTVSAEAEGAINGQQIGEGDNWSGIVCDPANSNADCDADGILNAADNCPLHFNPDQLNSDRLQDNSLSAAADGLGDTCDSDRDGDGLFEVNSADELQAIGSSAVMLAQGYELVGDLDISGINWQPIGDITTSFSGIFEGNGHTISGFSIIDDGDRLGLFGYIGDAGIVRNLRVVGSIRSTASGGTVNIGGLAGGNLGTIHSCVTDVDITASDASYNRIGGLVGELVATSDESTTGILINSYAAGQLNGGSGTDWLGGAIGHQGEFTTIRNIYFTGDIFGGDGDDFVGGLVGVNSGAFLEYGFATGVVDGQGGTDHGFAISSDVTQGFYVVQSYFVNAPQGSFTPVTQVIQRTLEQLRSDLPGAGRYIDWSPRVWDFGNAEQLPALRYSTDIGVCSTTASYNPLQPPQCGSLLPGQR